MSIEKGTPVRFTTGIGMFTQERTGTYVARHQDGVKHVVEFEVGFESTKAYVNEVTIIGQEPAVVEPVSKKPRKKVDKADVHPPIPNEGNKPEPVPLDTEVKTDSDMVSLGKELNPQENAVLSPSDEPAPEPDTESEKEEIAAQEPSVKVVQLSADSNYAEVYHTGVPVLVYPPEGMSFGTQEEIKEKLDELAADQDKWMKAIRYDPEYLGYQSAYKVYGRQKINGIRNYVVAYEGDQYPRFMPSCTSFMEMVLPKPKPLFEWAVNSFRNMDEYRAYMDEKAAIGTVIHGAIADLTNGELQDFSDNEWWDNYLKTAFGRTDYAGSWRKYRKQVFKAILSFLQYVEDYQVRIIALEIPVASKKLHLAGQLDLLVERNLYIQKKSGKHKDSPPRVICVDDIKTGDAHAFYAPQLGIYGEMLLESYPFLVDKIKQEFPHQVVNGQVRLHHGIFVPGDWKKPPTEGKGYKLSDFTEKVHSFMEEEFSDLHKVFMNISRRSKPGGDVKFTGKPEIGMEIASSVQWKPLHEVWAERIANGETGGDVDAVETEEGEDSTDE